MRLGMVATVLLWAQSLCAAQPLHFENDILPILGRHGCNSSGCHGKAEGQGGFKLSVFGSDPDADFMAIVMEMRGRRVFASVPEESLLLRKGSGRMAHGGGTKLAFRGEDYLVIRDWVTSGMPRGASDAPFVTSLHIEPPSRTMGQKASQQLVVFARYSDGSQKDVTRHARFQTNAESVATVTPGGLTTTLEAPGEAAIMAGYQGEVGLFRVLVPQPGSQKINKQPQFNFIDKHVDAKLANLNVLPSEICSDSDFLRRAFLDITGTLPTPDQTRRFLTDKSPTKRQKTIESLIIQPEYADMWAMRWADLLRVDREPLGHQNAFAYYTWIRDSIATNKPLDQFARELVTAEGPSADVGPAHFYKVVTKPGDIASTLSQVLLGVRITCAECHHHPFDRWRQSDYYGMTAFFNPGTVKHPRTQAVIHAHALGTAMPATTPQGDKRLVLADWMARTDNPFFARNMANRIWAWMLGKGLVEPVDDVRATNPPSNAELLDALAHYLITNNYDARKLITLIASSRVYQTSVTPNSSNEKDDRNFSRGYFKRPDAEVLLDMICQTLGVPEKFQGSPTAARAVQVWDSKVRHDFLKRFGRPSRVTACECERTREPSVSQVLNLLNSTLIQDKITHEGGNISLLTRRIADDNELIGEMYLRFYSRLPSETERAAALSHLKKSSAGRRQAAEDLAWAMLNSSEFLFNH